MEATVDALATYGYSGATTVRIQELAGVTRGRLLRQYPQRDQLLIDAVQHIASRQFAAISDQAKQRTDGDPIFSGIRLIWSTYNGPLFWAAAELWLAARSDEQLRSALASAERRLGQVVREMASVVFGATVVAHTDYPMVYDQVISSMRGVALTYSFDPRDHRCDRHLAQWEHLVRELVEQGRQTVSRLSGHS
jgi:AcrR family transcriptional regulator